MEEDSYEYIKQLESELQEADKERRNIAKTQLGYYESSNQEDNLVKWQLNLEEEKERIFHLLKGDRKGFDGNGDEVWLPPESKDSAILNEYGVDYIMGLLESFLNRNIILSYFDEDRIKEICMILGNQINEDIYNDYEKMGLDTDDKRKKYPMIVLKVMINVESALRRAMMGKERESLRKITSVTQNENPMRMSEFQMMPIQQKKTGWLSR